MPGLSRKLILRALVLVVTSVSFCACNLPVFGYLGNHPKAKSPDVVVGDSAVRLAVKGPPRLVAGQCTRFTMSRTDSGGNEVTAPADVYYSIDDSSGNTHCFSNSSCSQSIQTAKIESGQSSGEFYAMSMVAGDTTLLMRDASQQLGSDDTSSVRSAEAYVFEMTVMPAAAVVLEFVAGAVGPFSAGDFVPFTLRYVDLFGNAAPVAFRVDFSLSPSAICFETNSSLLGPTNQVGIAPGESKVDFFVKSDAAGTFVVDVSSFTTGQALASASVTFNPRAPTKFAFSGPTSITAGTCQAYTLSSKDNLDNDTAVTGNILVNLATSAGNFFPTNACSGAITSTLFTIGTTSQTLYFRNSVATTQSFAADDGAGGMMAATLPNVITTAASGSKLTLTKSGPNPVVNQCIGLTVTYTDPFGNPVVTSSAISVSLNSSNTAGKFYSAPGCATQIAGTTVAANTTSIDVYFSATTATSYNLTANSGGLSNGTLTVPVSPAGATKLVLSGAQTTIGTGTCGVFNIQQQDAGGNPSTTSLSVSLQHGGIPNASFYSDVGCTTAVTGLSFSSSNRAVYFKSLTATLAGLTVLSSGLTSGMLVVTISPGIPSRLLITGTTTVGAGNCTAGYQVKVADVNSNVTNATADTTVSLLGQGQGFYYPATDTACTGSSITSLAIAAGTSSAGFNYRNTFAQGITLSASATGLTTGTLNFTVAADSAGTLAISGPSLVPPGVCKTFSVFARDIYGNTAKVTGDTTIGFNFPGYIYTNSSCTNVGPIKILNNQTTASFFFKDPNTEAITLSAAVTLGNSLAPASAVIQVANEARLTFSDGPTKTFANTPVGGSTEHVFTITNAGTATASLLRVGATPLAPFSWRGGSFPGGGSCGATLSNVTGSNTCTAVAVFAPPTIASYAGATYFLELLYDNNNGDPNASARRAVAGTGNPASWTLHTGFSGDGLHTTNFGGPVSVNAVAVAPGGNIVIAGSYNGQILVARYSSAGALDTTFNTTGVGAVDATDRLEQATGVAVQPDGKIVVVGFSGLDAGRDFVAARLNPDGTMDTTFGVGGVSTSDLSGTGDADFATAVALSSSGKIFVTGSARVAGNFQFTTMCLNSLGSPESSFGAGGVVKTDFGVGDDQAFGVVLSGTDILITGSSQHATHTSVAVARYHSSGALQTSFGLGGIRGIDVPVGEGSGRSIAVQSDGRIVIGFDANDPATDVKTWGAARLTAAGASDVTFNGSGLQTTTLPTTTYPLAGMVLEANGMIILGGTLASGSITVFGAVRFDSSGAQDSSFGSSGVGLTAFSRTTISVGGAMTQQTDGKIVFAGYNTSPVEGAIARFWP